MRQHTEDFIQPALFGIERIDRPALLLREHCHLLRQRRCGLVCAGGGEDGEVHKARIRVPPLDTGRPGKAAQGGFRRIRIAGSKPSLTCVKAGFLTKTAWVIEAA